MQYHDNDKRLKTKKSGHYDAFKKKNTERGCKKNVKYRCVQIYIIIVLT